MTYKKPIEELNEAELDQVTGGFANLEVSHIKPSLTKAGIRATKGAGIRMPEGAGIRAGNVINGEVGKGEI